MCEVPDTCLFSSPVDMLLLNVPVHTSEVHVSQALVCRNTATLGTLLYWILGKQGILIFRGKNRSLTWHDRETGTELLQGSKQRVGTLRLQGYVLLLKQKKRLWKHRVTEKKLLSWKGSHSASICYEFPGSSICWHSNNPMYYWQAF